MSVRVPRSVAALLALAALAAAPAARAEPTAAELQQARELFAAAEKDERAAKWADALDELRRIERIKVTPGIRFHIALCEENTGQLAAALEDYARAEKQATEEKNREVLAALKDPMASLRARVPRLIVRVPPDVKGLEVAVDGKPLPPGYFNAEIPVDMRTHVIEARAPEHKPFNASVVTPEREVVTVEVATPDERAASTAAVRPAPAPPPVVTSGPPPAPQPESPAPPHHRARTGAILATAGAVFLVGAGVGAFLIAAGKQSDGQAECATRGGVSANCDDLRDPVRTWDALALGSWIAAGALGAVAVVLWMAPEPTRPGAARLVIGPGSAGVAGSF